METNPGLRRPVPAVCRILCCNVWGLAGNSNDLIMASSQYDILLCSETLGSDMCHVSELPGPLFGRSVVLYRARYLGLEGWLHTNEMVKEHPKFECGFCKMLVFSDYGERQNLYVFSLYSNPDLDDRIFDCLLASMDN